MNYKWQRHFWLLLPDGYKEVDAECSAFLYCKLSGGGRGVLGKGLASYYLMRGDWDITASKERAEAHLAKVGAR